MIAILSTKRRLLLPLLGLFLGGCAGDGYITSNIATVVGLDISENAKTQVPHVRFGYVRSGMYYVPTGKTGNPTQGKADETPTVVSDIFVHSKFLTDITISEKFAIGAPAATSRAAEQNFANNSAQAVASRGAVSTTAPSTILLPTPRPATLTDDPTITTLRKSISKREAADDARADAFVHFEAISADKKTPDFYSKVMTGAPPAELRTETGLTHYLRRLKDPAEIKAVDQAIIEAGK